MTEKLLTGIVKHQNKQIKKNIKSNIAVRKRKVLFL